MITRTLQSRIENSLFKGKIIILYGPRQAGKTTLVKEIQKKYPKNSHYINCDEPDVRQALTNTTSTELRAYIGGYSLVFIDEAQRVKNIGITLKLIADNMPNTQVVATGSSSFELSNSIQEPLTGRAREFYLHPLSLNEIKPPVFTLTELTRLIKNRLIYGMYPEVVTAPGQGEQIVRDLARDNLYKDVLQYKTIKHSEVLDKLLKALALQIGQLVSYNELANTVGVAKETVASYIRLLEQAFIIFRIGPFSKNLRSELKKLQKIYFYDTGIRNALISNFNPLDLRQDVGALWENFLMSERMKRHNNDQNFVNVYFWRTHAGQEIDLLEERKGELFGYEIKWTKDTVHIPRAFARAYPNATVELINKKNFLDFLIPANTRPAALFEKN